MKIDKYKLTLTRFTCELEKPLNSALRSVITTEVDIYAVEHRDLQNGEFDEIYKSKVVGSTEIKQGGLKPLKVKGKSKRSLSQQLRLAFMAINPDEEFYDNNMPKIIYNLPKVLELLKDK